MSGLSGTVDFQLAFLPDHWLGLQSRVFHLTPGATTHQDSRPGWLAARHINPRIDALNRQGPFALTNDRYLVGEALLKNRDALMDSVPQGPSSAHGMTDMQVLAYVVQHRGIDAIRDLKGFFAFALWCPQDRTLFLARDRVGDRTLFHAQDGRYAAFGTLPTALLDLPFVETGMDEHELAGLLSRKFKSHTRTLFKGVFQVPPGSYVTITPGGFTTTEYWALSPKPITGLRTRRDYADAMREHLDRAAAYMCRADGQGDIGIGLSGGLDSTAVAALAAPRLAAEGRPLKAFMSIPAPDEMDFLLSKHARAEIARAEAMVASQPNMSLFFDDGRGSPLLNGVEDLNRVAGHPFLSSARWYALHPHFESCSHHDVGVLLGGFSGNTSISAAPHHYYYRLRKEGRYAMLAWALAMRLTARGGMAWREIPRKILGLFQSIEARKNTLRRQSFDASFGLSQNLRRMWMPIRDQWLNEQGLDRTAFDSQLFDPKTLEDGTVMANWRAHQNSFQGQTGWSNAAIRVQYGVELRDVPGDSDLLEFCASIPDDILFHPRQRRHLIRLAMKGLVPDVIRNQKGKGYAAPAILKRLIDGHDVIDRHLDKLDNSPLCRRAFDRQKIDALIQTIPQKELENLADNYKHIAGLIPTLSVGSFVHWAEAGRPMNGLTQTHVKPPKTMPTRQFSRRCDSPLPDA